MKININTKLCSLIMLVLFTGIGYSETVPYRPVEGDLNAYICIERPENDGFLNIVSAEAVFSNGQRITVAGGEAACIIVRPDKYSFTISSPNPYPYFNAGKSKEQWLSKKVDINISEGQIVVFKLLPSGDKKGYTGKWELERIK